MGFGSPGFHTPQSSGQLGGTSGEEMPPQPSPLGTQRCSPIWRQDALRRYLDQMERPDTMDDWLDVRPLPLKNLYYEPRI